MSVDNYIYVRKREDGRYEISHRFASTYYRDEITEPPREYTSVTGSSKGWSVNGDDGPWFATMEQAIESSPIREDWVTDPPKPLAVWDSARKAIKEAFLIMESIDVVEYGVSISKEVVNDL